MGGTGEVAWDRETSPVATGDGEGEVPALDPFETVIGLEVHAQVLTSSKMFCGCPATYADSEPNTSTCPVCLGLPGAMPVMNARAVEQVLKTGLALGCDVPDANKQDRKSYFYPDLPKGYQVSQYDLPLCVGGQLRFDSGGEERRAGITRVHMEEDTGRLLHRTGEDGSDVSLVDLNRSGVPLMEIVGEPDLRSPREARDYLEALRQVLRYAGVSTGNMEEGAFRCDANVSVRRTGDPEYGQKVEIKNLNSFSAVARALAFEENRQRRALSAGAAIPQETRGWVEDRGITVSQRTKEHAHDYRYFPEPDLPPLRATAEMVERARAELPELPAVKRQRFVETMGLTPYLAGVLTAERSVADEFEVALRGDPAPARARAAANWIVNDLAGLAAARGLPSNELPLSGGQLAELLDLLDEGAISGRAAKDLLLNLAPAESPRAGAARLGLLTLDDDVMIRDAVMATMAAFPAAVQDFRGGKQAAIGRLIGETIMRTGGRASPDAVRESLVSLLTGGAETDGAAPTR